MFRPLGVLMILLYRTVTFCVTDHGAVPLSFCDLNTSANPSCASTQLFSNTLPSTSTRCAFLTSNRFFTVHTPRHANGLKKPLWRISQSEGIKPSSPG